MIRVLIADDQELVRQGLVMMLEAEADIDVVGEAGDGAEVLGLVTELDPDLVLMDIRMPGIDGIEATARLRRAGARAKVVVLTTFDLDGYVYQAMRAGASAFLLKDSTRDALVDAVRKVVAGDALLAPAITRRLIEDFCRRPEPAEVPTQVSALSPRELDVVRLIARGLSNVEIGRELFLAEPTVKGHVASVLTKLGLRDRVQVVILAYECGLVRPGS